MNRDKVPDELFQAVRKELLDMLSALFKGGKAKYSSVDLMQELVDVHVEDTIRVFADRYELMPKQSGNANNTPSKGEKK